MNFSQLLDHPLSYWVLIVILILSAIAIGQSYTKNEGMETIEQEKEEQETVQESEESELKPSEYQEFAPSFPQTGDKSELTPEDLLPKSNDVKNFESSFKQGQDGLNRNFITAGHHIGVNTVSSSLRNANLSLRSDPVIPRVSVGPWNDSTILASDIVNRKKFEIGSGI